jgi:hypothetical protein
MLQEQLGVCAICHEVDIDRRLSVDHNHVTGKVRGLLCRKCNTAITYLRDRPDLLIAAADYIRRNSDPYKGNPEA